MDLGWSGVLKCKNIYTVVPGFTCHGVKSVIANLVLQTYCHLIYRSISKQTEKQAKATAKSKQLLTPNTNAHAYFVFSFLSHTSLV